MNGENLEPKTNTQNIESDTYDRGIVPAETAARKEREGDNYKQLPEPGEGTDTTGGYTVDREGLLNNYAVEPEIYYETPGDAEEQNKQNAAERAQELAEVNKTDESGKLTAESDNRSKGVGMI
ncbi:hypothetical protein [Gloeocapsa sp. PCC 73106]|uniref:hypothetical protein n=1 Tax=Gloeocapsa sp. PCC 73106 TaxID=102232 RepID=UPI0002ACA898|nr:hypothetical protein [Gloeocapsa sp. PCC 73106]ELS00065.1 hypothetical protein GLO73106DRAFT_00039180 [Gloeocapsa sp. PCC 73106]